MKEFELYPHQKKAVAELHNGSILDGGVGTGKSHVALAYYVANEAPKDIYVITTAKKRDDLDWESAALSHGIGTRTSVSVAGKALGRLTVDSWNNVGKYTEVENAFFIWDEQRLVGSGAWVKSFYRIARRNRWILLSATPADTWLDYIPVFVANGFYKNKTEFLREHVIYSRFAKYPKVERYIAVGRLVKYRNQILVHMPYERNTTRHILKTEVEYDKELFERVVKDRWHVYENRPLRDAAEFYSVMRKVVNSDDSRLLAVETLLQKHPRLIVFYNFDYELEMLRTLAEPTMGMSRTLSHENTSTEISPESPSGLSMSPKKTISSAQCPWKDMSGCSCQSARSNKSSETSLESKCTERSTESSALKKLSESDQESQLLRGTTSSESGRTTGLDLTPSETCWTGSTSSGTFSGAGSGIAKSLSGSSLSTVKSPIHRSIPVPVTQPTPALCIAEWNGHKHQPIPTSDRWVYLVQYTAGAEGWNCIETDACVMFSLNYSHRIFEQCQGRIDRLNTLFEDLYYHVLMSNSAIDKMIWNAIRVKKNFHEKRTIADFEAFRDE